MATSGQLIATGFGLVVVAIGGMFAKQGLDQRRRARRIAATPTTAVRDLRRGLVELKGTARPVEDGRTHLSPISGTEALVSYVKVRKWGGRHSKTLHEDVVAEPFVLDDGTGEVRVEPHPEGTVTLDLREDKLGRGDPRPPDVRRFADRTEPNEFPSYDMLSGQRSYEEGVVEPGERAYVVGEAVEVDEGWGERGYEVVAPPEPEEFVVSDMPEEELTATEYSEGTKMLAFGVFVALFGLLFVILPLSEAGILTF